MIEGQNVDRFRFVVVVGTFSNETTSKRRLDSISFDVVPRSF